jgi:hypothetical protein
MKTAKPNIFVSFIIYARSPTTPAESTLVTTAPVWPPSVDGSPFFLAVAAPRRVFTVPRRPAAVKPSVGGGFPGNGPETGMIGASRQLKPPAA